MDGQRRRDSPKPGQLHRRPNELRTPAPNAGAISERLNALTLPPNVLNCRLLVHLLVLA